MGMFHGEGDNLMKPKATVKHERTHTVVAEMHQIPEIETEKKPTNFRISQNVNGLALCLWKPELLREVDQDIFLLITPSQERTQSPDLCLNGGTADISLCKVQVIRSKAV